MGMTARRGSEGEPQATSPTRWAACRRSRCTAATWRRTPCTRRSRTGARASARRTPRRRRAVPRRPDPAEVAEVEIQKLDEYDGKGRPCGRRPGRPGRRARRGARHRDDARRGWRWTGPSTPAWVVLMTTGKEPSVSPAVRSALCLSDVKVLAEAQPARAARRGRARAHPGARPQRGREGYELTVAAFIALQRDRRAPVFWPRAPVRGDGAGGVLGLPARSPSLVRALGVSAHPANLEATNAATWLAGALVDAGSGRATRGARVTFVIGSVLVLFGWAVALALVAVWLRWLAISSGGGGGASRRPGATRSTTWCSPDCRCPPCRRGSSRSSWSCSFASGRCCAGPRRRASLPTSRSGDTCSRRCTSCGRAIAGDARAQPASWAA